jgi:hypothetical protein
MRNWMMAMLPLVLVTGCNSAAPSDEKRSERSGPPASVGPITTQSFALNGFTRVEVAGPDDITIRQGDAFSITARGRKEALDRLEITLDGPDLEIGRKREGFSFSSRDEDDVDIAITMPRLNAVRLTGSGTIDADTVDGDAVEAVVTGSGDLKVAKLTGKRADITVSGSGDIEIAGGTIGSGELSVTGSGNVDAQATGKADISILGSGDVTLTGGANCSTRQMGSGTATCK